jgi:uncharacterized membrane protein YraQ (UPF0718 family)
MEIFFSLIDRFQESSVFSVLSTSARMFWHLWYYLVLGIVAGSLISVYMPRRKLSSLARESGFRGILIASLLGAVSPLGSYAVIPVFASMLAAGLPRAPMMTFLVASPLINPVEFILTWTVIHPAMAIVRLAAAVILGILCGVIVTYLTKREFFAHESLELTPAKPGLQGEAVTSAPGNPGKHEDALHPLPSNSGTKAGVEISTFSEHGGNGGDKLQEALTLMWKTAKYPGRYFLIAIVLAAALETYVPREAIVRYMGTGEASVLIAAALGIPLYVCGGGAIPLVAQFLNMGMDKGAALAFFVVGPATRIAPMVTVFSLVRKRIFLVYFLVALLGGIGLGYLYGVL